MPSSTFGFVFSSTCSTSINNRDQSGDPPHQLVLLKALMFAGGALVLAWNKARAGKKEEEDEVERQVSARSPRKEEVGAGEFVPRAMAPWWSSTIGLQCWPSARIEPWLCLVAIPMSHPWLPRHTFYTKESAAISSI
ncbi:hypothetical protein B296_00045759 [Ensete ventricosum]|uniref:Uncharacterized protein n=1 Tax=Ensete ventricosum TaxID=4639 RepID=A0A426Z6D9_ENSVE|nr:hypothetical protein B296_00045759 [Ensete ventricosum]